MTDQLRMFGPTTSGDSPSTTSLQASEGGPAHSDSPDGPMTGQSGQEAAPVSLSQSQESKKAMPTNDTSGPLFTTSSPSASLQRSLENRLHQNLDASGSPEYALTWKHWDMASGPQICALRASGRRTSGKDFGGWPTPNVPNGGQSISHAELKGGTYYHKGKKVQVGLEAAAKMTGWPTPTGQDNNQVAGVGAAERHPKRGTTIGGAVRLSPAQTEKPDALNPAFSLWLMGYPIEWASCGARVTRLSRKSRRSS